MPAAGPTPTVAPPPTATPAPTPAPTIASAAAALTYDFSSATADDDFVVFIQRVAVAGEPTTIQAWVNGDGSGNLFNIWVEERISWAAKPPHSRPSAIVGYRER